MERPQKVHEEASRRLDALEPARETTRRHVDAGSVRTLDHPDRIRLRIERLLKNPLAVETFRAKGVLEELRSSPIEALSPNAQGELERTIGGEDYAPVWFLTRGAEMRRTVGMVRARTREGRGYTGTGFLVAPGLLLTNHHVLDWSDINEAGIADIVEFSLVDFDFEERFDGVAQRAATFKLDPATLLLLDPWYRLDYVLVAVEPRSADDGGMAIESFGYNRLTGEQGKVNKGEPVFIVQHPSNQAKKVVFQNNRLIERAEQYLAYEADTDNGSSGAPVYNRQWEVVALHHATQIARDEQGRILALGGGLWRPDMGSRSVKFLDLNEGVRISRVVASLDERRVAIRQGRPNALGPVEHCTAVGLQRLDEMLAFRASGPPLEIAAPRTPPPSTLIPPSPGARSRSFPAPD